VLTIYRVDVWLSANEDADLAYRVLHPGDALLASGIIGAVTVANSVAGFVAVPAAIYSGRSCIRVDQSAPVFACALAWTESNLTKAFGFRSGD
jgi:hypothetical protein